MKRFTADFGKATLSPRLKKHSRLAQNYTTSKNKRLTSCKEMPAMISSCRQNMTNNVNEGLP
jgi:hypothetical protein